MNHQTIKNQYEAYLSEIEFIEKKKEELKKEDILSLKTKKGIVVPSEGVTDLWITRKISVMNILNIPTVMESALDEFLLRDSFGMVIWEGPSEEVYDYIEGFLAPA